MKRTLTITLRTLISDLLQPLDRSDIQPHDYYDHMLNPTARKFNENDLPLDIMVAYPHPTVIGLLVMGLADFSHAIKKATNAIERGNLRGPDLFPVIMKMLKDVYMEILDMKTDGQIMIYPKLRKEIFEKKCKKSHACPLGREMPLGKHGRLH